MPLNDLDLTTFNREDDGAYTKLGEWIDFMSDKDNSNMCKIMDAYNDIKNLFDDVVKRVKELEEKEGRLS